MSLSVSTHALARTLSQMEKGQIETDEEEVLSCYKKCSGGFYSCTSVVVRNIARLAIAGIFSMAGGIITSDPRLGAAIGISAVYIGSFVGGAANSCSTYFAYETNTEKKIYYLKAIIDHMITEQQATAQQLNDLTKRIEALSKKKKQSLKY